MSVGLLTCSLTSRLPYCCQSSGRRRQHFRSQRAVARIGHVAESGSIERVTCLPFTACFDERQGHTQLVCFSPATLTEPKGRNMNKNGASRIFGTMLGAAIASCAICANAQTGVSAPADAAVLRVTAPTPPPRHRPDTAVIRNVRRALKRVPDLDDSGIHIRSSMGVVTLTGTVPETWQISRAGIAARSALGVRAVTNRLTSTEDSGGH